MPASSLRGAPAANAAPPHGPISNRLAVATVDRYDSVVTGSPRFDRLVNFRDVGGAKTADGRTFKTGVVFRSEVLSRITERDAARLRALDLKLVCDLRTPRDSRGSPEFGAIRRVNVPLHELRAYDVTARKMLGFLFGSSGEDRFRALLHGYYHHIAFERTARLGEVLTLLSREENLPALIHCTAGRDRTGFVAAILQLVAGVPYETVLGDYLLTNDRYAPQRDKLVRAMQVVTLRQVPPERMQLLLTTHREFLDRVHARIVGEHGGIERYLEACNVDRDTQRALRERLVE
jgi:protein-tyrosine phosphatase